MSSSDNTQLRVCQVLINTLRGPSEESDSLDVGVSLEDSLCGVNHGSV